MNADVPIDGSEPADNLQNVELWEVLWSIESEASALSTAAESMIQREHLLSDDRPSWHERERADWRTAYDRPRADWREVYEANSPKPQPPEVIELERTPPSIDLPRIVQPEEPKDSASERRVRPASFASQIKDDAPPDNPGFQRNEVTGSFRNMVYGIDTETPAARLKDLLNQRAFDQLWTAGSSVDGDQFAAFFAQEGFGVPEEP